MALSILLPILIRYSPVALLAYIHQVLPHPTGCMLLVMHGSPPDEYAEVCISTCQLTFHLRAAFPVGKVSMVKLPALQLIGSE